MAWRALSKERCFPAGDQFRILFAHRRIVRYAGRRNQQGLQAGCMRLHLAQLLGPDPAHTGESIGFPTPVQFFQPGFFG